MYKYIILLFLSGWIMSCSTDEHKDFFSYKIDRPEHFPPIEYPISNNDISKAGFELGKKIFNDPMLSVDNSVACSNCHTKALAFTDAQHNPSVGVFDRSGTRNAPMIANMAFQSEFLWDGGINHLDFVPVFAIENPNEMDETLLNVVHKLNRHSTYPSLFAEVYPEADSITSPQMLQVLSQYMLLLISDQSKYDEVQRGNATFTESEKLGFELFNSKCASCHEGVLQTSQQFMNNGLDSVFTDLGRALITETDQDNGKFKVPSLRNIMLTAPYMHDGRLKTMDEVLNHYSQQVLFSATLAEELINEDGSLGVALTSEEKESIIAFLHTLTDHEFVSNPIF